MTELPDKLPFGLSWNQLYAVLLIAHVLVVTGFLIFSKYFT